MGKYETKVLPKLEYVKQLCYDGKTDKEIAGELDISEATLRRYKKAYPDFGAAMRRAKKTADAAVENSLYERATGILKTLKKPFKIKTARYDERGKKIEEERIEYADEEIYYPPDVAAMMCWLCNRQPQRWQNKRDITLDSAAGEKITVKFGIPPKDGKDGD